MDSNRKFSMKIHGNDYAVEIRKIDEGTATVEVNGTVYEVHYEAERKVSKTPTLTRTPVYHTETDRPVGQGAASPGRGGRELRQAAPRLGPGLASRRQDHSGGSGGRRWARRPAMSVERYGMVIGIKPDRIARYKELHASPWPGVLAKIEECHICNYSIYLREIEKGQYLLFSYFEYTGDDFAADMARMAADPETRRWWQETDPCQAPIPRRGNGEFWSRMDEVFHAD